jgi:hypothetical protein
MAGDPVETVHFPSPNRRNKGLKPLVSHNPLTEKSGFQVIWQQALSLFRRSANGGIAVADDLTTDLNKTPSIESRSSGVLQI